MKNAIYIFLALTFTVSLESKCQYFGLNFHEKLFYSTSLSYPKDGNYRVMAYDHSYPYRPQLKPIIKIYNQGHQLINTIGLVRGMQPNENPPLKTGSKLLWPTTYWDTTTTVIARYMLALLELDTLYHVVALHKIGGYTDSTGKPNDLQNSDDPVD